MTNPATTSLLDRANLDRDAVRHEIAPGLVINAWGYNAGAEDGIVGTNTIRALQKFLNAVGENAGTADGIAGPQTRAAFWNYNATGC